MKLVKGGEVVHLKDVETIPVVVNDEEDDKAKIENFEMPEDFVLKCEALSQAPARTCSRLFCSSLRG